ncbi:hypothetical protein D3C71_2056700 [compost metagenome]
MAEVVPLLAQDVGHHFFKHRPYDGGAFNLALLWLQAQKGDAFIQRHEIEQCVFVTFAFQHLQHDLFDR